MARASAPAGSAEGGFSPDEADAFLVGQWRAIAAHQKTYAHLSRGGKRTAWEACKTFADLLMPQASADFLRLYRDCRERRARGEWPIERLFLVAQLEAREQGRLGREALAVSVGAGILTRGMD